MNQVLGATLFHKAGTIDYRSAGQYKHYPAQFATVTEVLRDLGNSPLTIYCFLLHLFDASGNTLFLLQPM